MTCYIKIHPFTSKPNSLNSSSAASRSFCCNFLRASLGNQSFMKFRRAQSTLAANQSTHGQTYDWTSRIYLQRSADNTVGALHIGQCCSPRFCNFTRHLRGISQPSKDIAMLRIDRPYTEKVTTTETYGFEGEAGTNHTRVIIDMRNNRQQCLSERLNEKERKGRAGAMRIWSR